MEIFSGTGRISGAAYLGGGGVGGHGISAGRAEQLLGRLVGIGSERSRSHLDLLGETSGTEHGVTVVEHGQESILRLLFALIVTVFFSPCSPACEPL